MSSSRATPTGPDGDASPSRADPRDPDGAGPPRGLVVLALLSLYLIWGSTYLAIRFAVETIPPFLMAGARFLVAGGVLYAWARARGTPRPDAGSWRSAAVVGALLFVLGNGGVVWAEQHVPSGLVALLVATTPLWMVLIEWLAGRGPRPGPWLVTGILWGLVGVALLVSTEELAAGTPADLIGGVAVLGGAMAWSAGAIYSRHAPLPSSHRMSSGIQMLAGGAMFLVVALLAGEPARLEPAEVTLRSLLSLAYLIVFGAVVALSAFFWLMRVSTPARVSTHAYVNPVVALLLGWALADEPITPRTLAATAIILSAVVLVTARGGPRRRRSGPAAD